MEPTPAVSVVIPTRNRCDLVQDALRGLAEQTLDFGRFEVLVVDNGSSDGTTATLEQLAGQLPYRLTVVPSPVTDNGPAPARNAGVRAASGDIIAFTDSDCRPDPDWLKQGLAAFSEPEVAFASGVVDFKPEQVGKMSFYSRKTVISLEQHPTFPTANIFFRKALFLEHCGFDEHLSFGDIMGQAVEAADTDLAWRIKDAGYRNIFVKEAVVYHEVQVLEPKEWLLEPLRLFLLPALIQAHPGLREELLVGNLFFYRRSIYYYLLLIALLGVLIVRPGLLLMLPVLLVLYAAVRGRSVAPAQLWRNSKEVVLNTARNYIMSAALIYGSLRYKTLVL